MSQCVLKWCPVRDHVIWPGFSNQWGDFCLSVDGEDDSTSCLTVDLYYIHFT